jgi:hypothetical protein
LKIYRRKKQKRDEEWMKKTTGILGLSEGENNHTKIQKGLGND